LAQRARFVYRSRKDYYDEKAAREIVVPGFEKILNGLNLPVLALFGELDSQVDWRGAKALYEKSLKKNPQTDLTVKVLPNCSHAMYKCETGALFEDLHKFNWQPCDGYLESMTSWLRKKEFVVHVEGGSLSEKIPQ